MTIRKKSGMTIRWKLDEDKKEIGHDSNKGIGYDGKKGHDTDRS